MPSAAGSQLARNYLDSAGEEDLYLAMRHFWHPVTRSAEVRDDPCEAVLLGERLVLARLDGGIRCFPNICVHRGSALSMGWVENGQLRCRYHGWTYGADGICTSIPARFGTVIPSRARLRAYRVAERHGLVWVCLEDDPILPIPNFPEYDDPGFRVSQGPDYDWSTSAHRRVENFIDWSHLPWVHDGTLGSRDRPEVPDAEVSRDATGLAFGCRFEVPIGESGRDVDANYSYYLAMPLTVHLTRIGPAGQADVYVLMMTASPLGPRSCRSFWFIARNAPDGEDARWLEMEARVQQEDKPVVEGQRPEMLPFDISAELHIRGVDKASLEYRKWLVELARTLRDPVQQGAARPGDNR
jgi:phenylpropionate dioxygenase-like ring-hydroxylating dioxygenase large terminal subunit